MDKKRIRELQKKAELQEQIYQKLLDGELKIWEVDQSQRDRHAFRCALWYACNQTDAVTATLLIENILVDDRLNTDDDELKKLFYNPETMSELEALKILKGIRQPLADAFDPESLNNKSDAKAFDMLQKLSAYGRALIALDDRHNELEMVKERRREVRSSFNEKDDEKTCRICGSKDGTVSGGLCSECFKKEFNMTTKWNTIETCLQFFAYVTAPLALIAIAVKLLLT